MTKEEAKTQFAQTAILLADKYGVKLKIDWEKAILDFHGEIEWQKWETLIAELNVLASEMEVADEQPLSWI